MAVVPVQCPQCQSIAVVKYGKQPNGTQRYRCQNPDCARRICLLAYQNLSHYQPMDPDVNCSKSKKRVKAGGKALPTHD